MNATFLLERTKFYELTTKLVFVISSWAGDASATCNLLISEVGDAFHIVPRSLAPRAMGLGRYTRDRRTQVKSVRTIKLPLFQPVKAWESSSTGQPKALDFDNASSTLSSVEIMAARYVDPTRNLHILVGMFRETRNMSIHSIITSYSQCRAQALIVGAANITCWKT